jgi:hypothetical protein
LIVAEEIIAFMPDRMQKVGVWEGMEIIEVEFYDSAADELLKFAVIITNQNIVFDYLFISSHKPV